MSDGGGTERDLAFVSYAHQDRHWLDWLAIWLKPYLREGNLRIWADPYIQVGDRWERTIDDALSRTRVGVLLLSQHFAASDFIAEVELPALRKAAEADLVRLFCVPVSSFVGAELMKLDGYQWARARGQPLDLLSEPERNRAMVEITEKLVALFRPGPTVIIGHAGTGKEALVAALLAGRATATPAVPVEPVVRGLRTDPGSLHGVPDLPPHFVARAAALGEIKKALLESAAQRHGISAAPRAGLHGQGGIGKTVLATALCRDEDVRRAFADGVYWLTFGQEPDLIGLQRLFLELVTGRRVEIESLILGAVALRDALGEKNCLLVLDDVWQGAHAAAFEVLGPRGRLLVTTRDREILDALGARALDLELLPPNDAVNLLARWAGAPSKAPPPEAAEIARECGYLPLALSLAGAQIGAGTAWTDVAEALRRGNLEFLDHAHRSVFKTLALSVRALSPVESERYRELAIFPEDVEIPETTVVRLWSAAGLGEVEARKLLVRFASRALLFVAGAGAARTVRFHDLQGDYLRLVARELPAAHARLLDAHYRLLPGSEPGAARWASLPHDETFLWRHLLHHLAGAGHRATADAVASDRRWLAAKIATTGVSSFLVDLGALVERAPTAVNQRIERALRLESGWLHVAPEALESLLYNRLLAEGTSASEIEVLVPGLRPPVRLAHPVNFGGGRVFRGHSGAVNACAYSPDGSRVLSASYDKTLREWDRSSGMELRRFEGHSGSVKDCAYSPDGSRVLSASADGTLREWDRNSGNELQRFKGHSGEVGACAYSPDGSRVLSASGDSTLREWDRSTGKELSSFKIRFRSVVGCAYSPDGSRVLSASYDNTLREWDRSTGKNVRRFHGHSDFITACTYSPDGSRVLSASWDNTLREWDPSAASGLGSFQGHSGWVSDCAYSPDAFRVLSASWDRTLREWDGSTGKQLRRFEETLGLVTACAYASDGSRVLFGSGHILCERDLTTGKELQHFHGHSSSITRCGYSPDGSRVVSASDDNTLREWDRSTGKEVHRFEGHSRTVTACVYSPDGSRVLSASGDYTLREWDCSTGKEVHRFDGHLRAVTACAYSPDGSRVLSASSDNTLREWDRSTGREVHRFDGHSGYLTACGYSPDGKYIVSASADNTLKIWSTADGRCLATVYGAAAFGCVAVATGRIAAGDALGNVWMLNCDWF